MKISRSVSFFAIALAAGCALSPLIAGAAAPVPIESLTIDQRLTTSPADTQVTVDGRLTTLGVLRSEHIARMSRLKSGASLGATAVLKLKTTLVGGGKKLGAIIDPRMRGERGTSTPPPVSSTPTLALPNETQMHWATDYLNFCNQSNISLCTYLPNSTTLKVIDQSATGVAENVLRDKDPLITDQSICGEGGGQITQGGCIYLYPSERHVQFDPKQLVSFTSSCSDGTFSAVNDPHGAAEVRLSAPPSDGGTFTTGASATWCVATVMVDKSK